MKVTDEEADRWTTRGLRAAGEALIARIYRGWLRGGRRERKGAHCLAQIRDIGRLRVALFVVDTRHVGSVAQPSGRGKVLVEFSRSLAAHFPSLVIYRSG